MVTYKGKETETLREETTERTETQVRNIGLDMFIYDQIGGFSLFIYKVLDFEKLELFYEFPLRVVSLNLKPISINSPS